MLRQEALRLFVFQKRTCPDCADRVTKLEHSINCSTIAHSWRCRNGLSNFISRQLLEWNVQPQKVHKLFPTSLIQMVTSREFKRRINWIQAKAQRMFQEIRAGFLKSME